MSDRAMTIKGKEAIERWMRMVDGMTYILRRPDGTSLVKGTTVLDFAVGDALHGRRVDMTLVSSGKGNVDSPLDVGLRFQMNPLLPSSLIELRVGEIIDGIWSSYGTYTGAHLAAAGSDIAHDEAVGLAIRARDAACMLETPKSIGDAIVKRWKDIKHLMRIVRHIRLDDLIEPVVEAYCSIQSPTDEHTKNVASFGKTLYTDDGLIAEELKRGNKRDVSCPGDKRVHGFGAVRLWMKCAERGQLGHVVELHKHLAKHIARALVGV